MSKPCPSCRAQRWRNVQAGRASMTYCQACLWPWQIEASLTWLPAVIIGDPEARVAVTVEGEPA